MTLDTTFLGLIALATVTMAAVQIGVIVVAMRMAKKAQITADELKRDLAPIIANARKASDQAAQVTAIALRQAERVEEFVSTATARVEETFESVQDAIHGVRSTFSQGSALAAGLKAAFGFFNARRARRQHEDDEDESLFIG